MRKRVADAAAIAGLAALYVLVARTGLAIDPVAGFATFVWPPSGISLAVLLLFGVRLWPGVLLGAFVTNVLTGAPPFVAVGIALGNTSEVLLGTWMLRRIPRFVNTLENIPSALGLIGFAGVLSPMVAATVGVVALHIGGSIDSSQARETWRAWWIGDMVGILLFAPVILVWSAPQLARFRTHWSETIGLATAVVTVSLIMFFNGLRFVPSLSTPLHDVDLMLAVLIWAALRFGQRGAVTMIFAVSAAAVLAIETGYGPFVVPDAQEGLMSVQTFMAIVASMFLLVGATLAERRTALNDTREGLSKAAAGDRAKSEFLTVMSHELRTPLTAIAGYVDLLASGVYGDVPVKQKDALTRIGRSERELLGLIDAVLTFVKLEKGEIAVHHERVGVSEAFDAIAPLVDPDVRLKHVVVERAPTRPRLAVQADRKGLEQILGNLLRNASKFSAEGGVITLGAEPVDSRVRIWVRDTGVGISNDDLQQVFLPFFQAERGTTRRFGGIGLGLTIARDLAHRMDGEVTITSANDGTTASVILPAA
ncbi:MAG TPA: MASE1 domain-containing protein [Gemmatimonadaceae bacterium]|nr:MASE1 domain-containing protein [Gemmatimonadaceae bacterium]